MEEKSGRHLKAVGDHPVDVGEAVTVPLVIYSASGKRFVVGEATLRGTEVIASMGSGVADEVMTTIFGEPNKMQFSLGYVGPDVDEIAALPPFHVVGPNEIMLNIKDCTCPWNHGYVRPGILPKHHVDCPKLKKQHSWDDGCEHGHSD